jgi:flagellum-specific peptidoglycan hydrolase FlgJ
MNISEFIETFKETAIDSSVAYNIFPSVTMAQAILESAYGNSELAINANNFFGIKAFFWEFDTYKIGNNIYRKYESAKDSFYDHSIFLYENNRYKEALKATNPFEQIALIHSAGYAEDENYTEKISNLIYEYNLQDLDKNIGEIMFLPEVTVTAMPTHWKSLAALAIVVLVVIFLSLK